MSFRGAVQQAARDRAWHHSNPRDAYAFYYREEYDEAFSALVKEVLRQDPRARLVRHGSDMGGPIWKVEHDPA